MFTDADDRSGRCSTRSSGGSIDRTFNCVSASTPTRRRATPRSSSPAAPPARSIADDFEAALHDVALSLTKQVARDGEGAETLIEVHVDGARDGAQAKRVAKAIVNSPLVKTAVHGADPNWGRVAMAVGKCSDDTDIDQAQRRHPLRRHRGVPAPRRRRRARRAVGVHGGDDVLIHVSLATGDGEATVWGCDLTAGYVRINADYTT